MGLENLFLLQSKINDEICGRKEYSRLMDFLRFPLVLVRGAGDLATGVIVSLRKAGFYVIALETNKPSAIRREVAFSDAVYFGEKTVEGIKAKLADLKNYKDIIRKDEVPIIVDPNGQVIENIRPYVLVDAIIAKRNLGTNKRMAELTIALGPGFRAGKEAEADVDVVIETMRGHNLARIIVEGEALPNTGVPGVIAGKSIERVVYSPEAGIFRPVAQIGDIVVEGEKLADIEREDGSLIAVRAPFKGVLRGVLPDGFKVRKGFKSADIDPRENERMNCFTISDKSRALGNATTIALIENLLARFDKLI